MWILPLLITGLSSVYQFLCLLQILRKNVSSSNSSLYQEEFYAIYKQDKINYVFEKGNLFEGKEGVFAFSFHIYYEYYRSQFENDFLFFLSNLEHFKNFQNAHDFRYFHQGMEDNDLIYFEAMHRNYRFLCHYLNIDNSITKLIQLKKVS